MTMMETRGLLVAMGAISVYLIAGAFLFKMLEGPHELERQAQMLNTFNEFLHNNTCISRDALQNLLDYLKHDLDTARDVFWLNSTKNVMWDATGAGSFAFSVITTIGYGNITPRSSYGRISCMLYATIGIPLVLVFLTGTGEKLSKLAERLIASKLGCCSNRTYVRRWLWFCEGIGILVIVFVLPTVVNTFVEGWTVLESIYYCFITVTTIGFGDLVASNPVTRDLKVENKWAYSEWFRLFSMIWALISLATISMLITNLMKYYVHSTKMAQRRASLKLKMFARRVSLKSWSSHTSSTPTPTDVDVKTKTTFEVDTITGGAVCQQGDPIYVRTSDGEYKRVGIVASLRESDLRRRSSGPHNGLSTRTEDPDNFIMHETSLSANSSFR